MEGQPSDHARNPRTTLAVLIALLAAALAAIAFAPASITRAPAAADLATAGQVPPLAQAQAPTPRNLTFYMHNSTLAKDVNGVSTPYVFDTVQAFGRNNTVSKAQEVTQDWYLFPMLAGTLTVNGSVTLHVYVSIDLAGAQINPTLTLSERTANGTVVPVATQNYGSQAWWTAPHDLVLSLANVHHTFAAGSSILVVASIVSGVRVATLWYNASWVPTHLIVQSDDFARVDSLAFLDAQGTPRNSFDPMAADEDITIRVNVTDPLGGYDVAWVNLTLVRPGGALALDHVAVPKVAGTPVSYASTYALVWNYSGQPVGRYNATAGVLDNSGLYYFREFFGTDGFLAQQDAYFFIGGLPVYVNVKVVDSTSVALTGASVSLVSGGVAVEAETSGAGGLANFTMAKGNYTLRVTWEGVQVANPALDAAANVSSSDPVIVPCAVYYPTFLAEDANGAALAGASLLFVRPDGQQVGPYETNASGMAGLSQVPVGAYLVMASWRGVSVFHGTESVTSNGAIAFETRVYELTVVAKASDGQNLAGVFVSVLDTSGLVFDAGISGSDGSVILRLPAGNYTVDYRYITTDAGTTYDSGVRSVSVSLTASQTTTVTLGDFPLPFTSTLEFQFVLVYGITVAALLGGLFLVWRRKKGTAAPAKPEEIESKP